MPHRDGLAYLPAEHFQNVGEDKFILDHFPVEIIFSDERSAFLHSSPCSSLSTSLFSPYHPETVIIWIKEKPYEQNKRTYCKAKMNGVSLLLFGSLMRLWLHHALGISLLICFLASFTPPSMISILLRVHRTLHSLLFLRQWDLSPGCQQGHLVLASDVTAGKWHYQGPSGASGRNIHSVFYWQYFPLHSFKIYF